LLPKDQWTKPEDVSFLDVVTNASIDARQDTPYLTTLIEEIEAELNEKKDLDSMQLKKKGSS